MSSAFSAEIELLLQMSLGKNFRSGAGHFYLLGLEVEEVVMVDADQILAAGKSGKPKAPGCFWEEGLSYAWDEPDEDGVFELRVTGNFAFEFRHEKDLEKYTIDDGPLESVTIGWAIDGDSPKSIAKIHGLSASLSNVEDHEEFEGL